LELLLHSCPDLRRFQAGLGPGGVKSWVGNGRGRLAQVIVRVLRHPATTVRNGLQLNNAVNQTPDQRVSLSGSCWACPSKPSTRSKRVAGAD